MTAAESGPSAVLSRLGNRWACRSLEARHRFHRPWVRVARGRLVCACANLLALADRLRADALRAQPRTTAGRHQWLGPSSRWGRESSACRPVPPWARRARVRTPTRRLGACGSGSVDPPAGRHPRHCQRPPRGPLICRPDVKTLATRAPRPESPVRTSPSSCVRRKFPSRSRPRRGLSKGSARFPACPEQHERRHPDATQRRQRRAHRDPVPRHCQDRQHHKQQHEAQTESLEDYPIPHADLALIRPGKVSAIPPSGRLGGGLREILSGSRMGTSIGGVDRTRRDPRAAGRRAPGE